MEDDKIKYSDIIQPDDSIERLISQLEEFTKQYSTMTHAIRAGADRIVHAVKSASGATSEGRKSIDEAALATSRLERAQRELRIALSDTGKQIAWLKAQTIDTNKATVEQQRYIRMAISSYDRLKADLKESVELYKSLTAAERADSEMGQKLLTTILNLKSEIAALDAQMRPHIQTLTAVEKAQKKLAFIQSEEGQQLLDLQNKIRAEIAARRAQKKSLSEIEKARLRLINAQSDENRELKFYSIRINEANQIAKLQAQIAASAEGSYNRLSAQYALNKIQLNAMSGEQREATAAGKALEEETLRLYVRMRELQEATGNYRLSVGHYQRAFDNLGFSVAQVVRELPALAVSANTFFLAISNNIPLVADEIYKLRISGEKTTGIIKKIVGALFNWNTGLVLLLSVFSVFGQDIINWVKGLFGVEKELKSAEEALGEFGEALKSAGSEFGKSIITLKQLQKEWSELKTNAEKTKWLDQNKDKFESLGVAITSVTDAEKLLIDQSDSFIEALKSRAKATAAQSLAAEKYSEALVEAAQIEELRFAISIFETQADRSIPGNEYWSLAQERVSELQDELRRRESTMEQLTREADRYFEAAFEAEEAAENTLARLGISAATTDKDSRTAREGRDLTDRIYRMRLDARKKYEDSLTELEHDEWERRKREAVDAANAEIRALEETYRKNEDFLNDPENKYRELTSEERQAIEDAQREITTTIINTRFALNYTLEQLEQEHNIRMLEIQRDALQLRLEAVASNTQEELTLRRQLLEVEEQIALAQNASLPTEERQETSLISTGFARQRRTLEGEYSLVSLEQQQALEEARFNEVKRSQREITRFNLQQEKARWERQIELAESGALDWTETEIEAAKSNVKGIDRELSELDDIFANIGEKGLGTTLLESLGFNDDQIDALTEATNIVIDNIKAILDAELEAAEAAVEAAEERVSAAQLAYDAEVEARNNGYANNVSTTQKELQLEKKRLRDRQKLLEAAQKRQESLDSITQASSLTTASANIWSSFSGLGPFGVAAAIAAIGTMWASFAAAKIKARQITAQASEEYGEGGLEFLEGGSHASGNDIDLGVTNRRKKRMHAEGGEAMAIINRKSTRRYRKMLPEIVESINKGIFEDKYINAFSAPGFNTIMLNNSNVDLTKLEKDVSAIKKQYETKYSNRADGSVLIIHKNVKRIVKNN